MRDSVVFLVVAAVLLLAVLVTALIPAVVLLILLLLIFGLLVLILIFVLILHNNAPCLTAENLSGPRGDPQVKYFRYEAQLFASQSSIYLLSISALISDSAFSTTIKLTRHKSALIIHHTSESDRIAPDMMPRLSYIDEFIVIIASPIQKLTAHTAAITSTACILR